MKSSLSEHRALFVSIEGIEASGKSTFARGLARKFEERGTKVVLTHEPGGTALGAALRAIFLDPAMRIDPAAEALLLNASRAQLVAQVIRPALADGAVVISDRFFDSTLAYQGYGRGMPLDHLRRVIADATLGLEPDVTFLIDIPVALSRSRLAERAVRSGVGADRLEQEALDFHERVRAGYRTLCEGSERIVMLDGTLEPAALVDVAWDYVASRGRRTA